MPPYPGASRRVATGLADPWGLAAVLLRGSPSLRTVVQQQPCCYLLRASNTRHMRNQV